MRATVDLPPEALAELARQVAEKIGFEEPEPWIGVEDAAVHMGCKPQRVYELVHQERLTPGHDGRRLVFRRSELDAYLASSP